MFFFKSTVWRVVVGFTLILASTGGLAFAVCDWYDCSLVHATGPATDKEQGTYNCIWTFKNRAYTGLARSNDGDISVNTSTDKFYNAYCDRLCTELPPGNNQEVTIYPEWGVSLIGTFVIQLCTGE